ncbi:MAG: hypothetical protein JXR22_02350 [Prolixibacteraceae bacterium]|nr:hypothetical protein [Prolixibacteraceae bacterium]
MKTCSKCLINQHYPKIHFDEQGQCSLCSDQKTFHPLGEEKLKAIFETARKKQAVYDALVPLSGGKDSTYILFLAVKVYGLKVLAMTYNNGFLSELAKDNIRQAISITGVDHVFCFSDKQVQQKIYREMLLASGDLCGVCDIATKAHILKTASEHAIPIILYGTSPLEEDSFVPDTIQDLRRLKFILRQSKQFKRREINDFLIFPRLNNFSLSYRKMTGRFAREVRPFFYLDNQSDAAIGEIVNREMNWKDDGRTYSRHLDCVAEPFTNYLRNQIYGYERRRCQFSNMIRKNELSRDEALKLFELDRVDHLPGNYRQILQQLNCTDDDLPKILAYQAMQFENKVSRMNQLFAVLMQVKRKLRTLQHR